MWRLLQAPPCLCVGLCGSKESTGNIFGLWQEDLYDQDFGVTRRRQGLGASEPFALELAQAQGLCDEPVEHEVVS
jgi:hypothetical protein